IAPGKPLPGMLLVTVDRRERLTLRATQTVRHGSREEGGRTLAGANRSLPLPPPDLVVEEATTGDEEGWAVTLTDCSTDPAEGQGEVLSVPKQMATATAARKKAKRRLVLGTLLALLALTLFFPRVLAAAQWVSDLLGL